MEVASGRPLELVASEAADEWRDRGGDGAVIRLKLFCLALSIEFPKWFVGRIPMGDNVIIIGAAKSGTSTLFHHLGRHRRVNISAGKEPHYFCDGFYEDYVTEGTAYEDLWDDVDGDVYLEASTGYTKHPVITGAPENMKKYGICPKFIYMVREPIGRMASHAKYMMWRRDNMNVDKLRKICLTTSMYYTQISRYVDVFGVENVKIVLLRDLSESPEACTDEAFRFIGLESVPVDQNRRENKTREVTNFELRIRNAPVWKLRHLLPDRVKSGIRSVWSTFSESPEMNVIRSIPREEIRVMCDDALRLEELFEVDLNPWREKFARSKLVE